MTIRWQEAFLTTAFRLGKKLQLGRLVQFRESGSSRVFIDYFKGFERVEAIQRIFGDRTEEVLRSLQVDFFPMVGFMAVNGSNGHLMVNPRYLNSGDRLDVYLDVVHELVHVRQHMEGRGLFDSNYGYADRPTEVEAYRYAVEEARRLGVGDDRICEYLRTPWMSEDDLMRLARALNVKCS